MSNVTDFNHYKKKKQEEEIQCIHDLGEKLDEIDSEELFRFLLGAQKEDGTDKTLSDRFMEENADDYLATMKRAREKAKETELRFNEKFGKQ